MVSPKFGSSSKIFVSLMVLEVLALVAAVVAMVKRSRVLRASFLVAGAAGCAAVLAQPEARLADIVPTLVGWVRNRGAPPAGFRPD